MSFLSQIRQGSRHRRLERFKSFLAASGLRTSTPLRIVDLGGTVEFWNKWWKLTADDNIHITLINDHLVDLTHANERNDDEFIVNLNRDANLLEAADFERFDLVFSNSFFEHLSSWEEQFELARKICASGKPYFIQTPNKYSAVDPHFPLAPFFATYPEWFRVLLVCCAPLGVSPRAPTLDDGREWQKYYRPLGRDDLRRMFPTANIDVEHTLVFPISLIARYGSAANAG